MDERLHDERVDGSQRRGFDRRRKAAEHRDEHQRRHGELPFRGPHRGDGLRPVERLPAGA